MKKISLSVVTLLAVCTSPAFAEECTEVTYSSDYLESSENAVSKCEEKNPPEPIFLCSAKVGKTGSKGGADTEFQGLQVYDVKEIKKTDGSFENISNGFRVDVVNRTSNTITYFENDTASAKHTKDGHSSLKSEFKLKEKFRVVNSDNKATVTPSANLERTVVITLKTTPTGSVPLQIDTGDGRVFECGFGVVADSLLK